MLLPAALLTIALGQALQDDVWLPTQQVAVPGLAEATCAADAAPWIAFVQVLPLPDGLRRYHAPHPPWRLARVDLSGVPEVVAEAQAVRGGGWGAPSFLAVADDGTVAATWRPGHEVLVAPPKQRAILHKISYGPSRSCVGLSTAWIVHREDATGALFARGLTTAGAEDDQSLDAIAPSSARLAFNAPWLVWIEPSGRIAVVDIERREKRSIPLPTTSPPEIDGIWSGHLFLHESGEHAQVHVIDLDRSLLWSLPAPRSVIRCAPEGVFFNHGFWDPVRGVFREFERAPGRNGIQDLLRRGEGVLWFRKPSRGPWHELRTLDDPVARPDAPASAPSPELPPPTASETGDAAREAWRAVRGH